MWGRIANFVNGELFGRGPTSVPWAVKFPQEMGEFPSVGRDAIQRADAQGLLPPEMIYQFDAVAYLIERVQAGDPLVTQAIAPALTARHPSQLYAAGLEGLLVFAIVAWYLRKPRPAGRTAALFCLVYGVVRIINEFFRNPDTQLLDQEFAATRDALGIGITRGQWLSVGLILIGFAAWWVCRNKPAMGGWQKTSAPPERRSDS